MLNNPRIRLVTTGQERFGTGSVSLAKTVQGLWNAKAYQMLLETLLPFEKGETIVHVHSWGSALSPSIFKAIKRSGLNCAVTGHDYLLACANSCFFNYQKSCICHVRPYSLRCLLTQCDKEGYLQSVYRFIRGLIQNRQFEKLKPNMLYVTAFQESKMQPFVHRRIASSFVLKNPLPDIDKRFSKNLEPGNAFLFVGRLVPGKGAELFCEAVEAEGLNGIVYGTGELEPHLKARFTKIDFRGWGDPSTIKEAMASCRALVFPSLFYEAAPLSPFEAKCFACLPSIVSSDCSAADSVIDGKTGLLFQTGDGSQLRRCLRSLMDDELVLNMKREVKAEAPLLSERSLKRYSESLLSQYDHIIGRNT